MYYVTFHHTELETKRKNGTSTKVYHAVPEDSETAACGRPFRKSEQHSLKRWKKHETEDDVPDGFTLCPNCKVTGETTKEDLLAAIGAAVGFEPSGKASLTKEELQAVLETL